MRLFTMLAAMLVLASSPVRAQDSPGVRGGFFALFAADIERLRDWYVEVLGFEVVMFDPAVPAPNVSKAALLRRGDYLIEMAQLREPGVTTGGAQRIVTTAGWAKVGLIVDDLTAAERWMESHGAAFNHRPVRSGVMGMGTFSVRDPEGNTIQFLGPMTGAP